MDNARKPFSFSLHLTALFVTLIVFAIGIWVGNYLASQVNDQFYNEIDSLQVNNVNLEFLSLLENDSSSGSSSIVTNSTLKREMCTAIETSGHNLGVQTADVGRRLRLLEEKRETGSTSSLQQRYFALEARDYLFWKKLKKLCNTKVTILVYFYRANCSECANVESVIGEFKKMNPPGILVYSFNLDEQNMSPAIAMLSTLYSVDNAPIVVVNEHKLTTALSVESLQSLQ